MVSKARTHASSIRNKGLTTKMMEVKACPLILCSIEESSEDQLMQQWSFPRDLTQTSFSKLTSKSTTPKPLNNNERKQQRNSLQETSKPQKLQLASKTSISRQISLLLSLLTRHPSMKSPVKPASLFLKCKPRGQWDKLEAFHKRPLLKITNFSCSRTKLNPFSLCFAARL